MSVVVKVTNSLPVNRSVSIRIHFSGRETRMKEVASGKGEYALPLHRNSNKKKECKIFVLEGGARLSCFLFLTAEMPKSIVVSEIANKISVLCNEEKADQDSSIEMDSYVNGCMSFWYSPYEVLEKRVAKLPKTRNGYVTVQ